MLKFNFYGHACFQLDDGKYKLLFDPFLTGNPLATIKADEVEADYVLITHAHGDHSGDGYDIVVRTGATAIGIPEVTDFGGENTMGIEDAAKAVEFLGAKNVIPVHYNTWPPIKQDPEEFKKLVKGAKVHIVKPGESLNLDA